MELSLDSKGFPTLAKFQFVVWTLVIAFSYFAIQIILIIETDYSEQHGYLLDDIPENLLAMMALSVTVSVISIEKSLKIKPKENISFRTIFSNLQGKLDLAEFQMFLWTIIGVSVYLHTVFDEILTVNTVHDLFLPDVNPTLVILMGLSQGAYLGSKYTEKLNRKIVK